MAVAGGDDGLGRPADHHRRAVTETKELIAGFALVQVRSHEEAVEWARRFVDLFDGVIDDLEVDIRRVAEASDITPA